MYAHIFAFYVSRFLFFQSCVKFCGIDGNHFMAIWAFEISKVAQFPNAEYLLNFN